jgi:hypothetical protein
MKCEMIQIFICVPEVGICVGFNTRIATFFKILISFLFFAKIYFVSTMYLSYVVVVFNSDVIIKLCTFFNSLF